MLTSKLHVYNNITNNFTIIVNLWEFHLYIMYRLQTAIQSGTCFGILRSLYVHSGPKWSKITTICCFCLEIDFRLRARGGWCCGIFHNYWWTASIKPLIFSPCKLCFLRTFILRFIDTKYNCHVYFVNVTPKDARSVSWNSYCHTLRKYENLLFISCT